MKKQNKINEKKEGDVMGAVLDIKKHSEKKEESYSLIDMITDPEYRKETYKYFDNKYEETKDEKKIFEAWKRRRKRGE
jgi:hypothetical protein